jgi:hypothetical protein
LKYWLKTGSVGLGEFLQVTQDFAAATGIAVKGSDVYVCGYLPNPSHNFIGYEAAYWKNGDPIFLGDSTQTSFATGIAISGGDIYISGYYFAGPGYARAVYWRNGIEVVLSDSTHSAPMAKAIVVAGTDIYVAGSVGLDPQGSKPAAVVWKNGILSYLGDTSQGGVASCLAIVNGDVYAGGWTGVGNNVPINSAINYATYWKNGMAFNLHDSGWDSRVNGIAVLGGDVYAVGNSGNNFNRAAYWKNGSLTILGQIPSSANSIVISGSDVLIGGSDVYAGTAIYATYWKNGNPIYINSGTMINAMCAP